MPGIKRVFSVDGAPFFPLGGQAQNSSGYSRAEAEQAFRAVKALRGNTLEVPVYWEQVEPEEGHLDWQSVDELLEAAREYGLKLILLWFATWKNGCMKYAPAWVKADPSRFKRVITATGRSIWVLSSHCEATLEADRRAFTELCRHLAERDGRERSVIGLQIENEPGILGAARDHGPEAEAQYKAEVPEALVQRISQAEEGPLFEIWQRGGAKHRGNWPEVFGNDAAEIMTAWSIAHYIDSIAEAGKAVYDILMYVNVWLGDTEWSIPGDSYPSGGGVSKVLDIYRWFAPHVDLIAPDIYIQDAAGYARTCAAYSRVDNPLFVPESPIGGANSWNIFRAIADYDAIGYACFGVERLLDEEGLVRSECADFTGSFRCAAMAIPLILRYQGTGRIHAVVQQEYMTHQRLDLGDYTGLVTFGDTAVSYVHKDWRHPPSRPPQGSSTTAPRGRGLIFQANDRELYAVGGTFVLNLRRKGSPDDALDICESKPWLLPRLSHFQSVDEGYLDDAGRFVVTRRRNGDETDYGVWVEPDVGLVRVLLCD